MTDAKQPNKNAASREQVQTPVTEEANFDAEPAARHYLKLANSADPWAGYDSDAFREALRNVAGLFMLNEREPMIENIDRGREEGTRTDDLWEDSDPVMADENLRDSAGQRSPEDAARENSMVQTTRTITIDDDSELGKALADADATRIVLVQHGRRYLVTADPDDLWANYDPEKARAALHAVAGAITPEEADRMIENIYRWREEGTRPIDRP